MNTKRVVYYEQFDNQCKICNSKGHLLNTFPKQRPSGNSIKSTYFKGLSEFKTRPIAPYYMLLILLLTYNNT